MKRERRGEYAEKRSCISAAVAHEHQQKEVKRNPIQVGHTLTHAQKGKRTEATRRERERERERDSLGLQSSPREGKSGIQRQPPPLLPPGNHLLPALPLSSLLFSLLSSSRCRLMKSKTARKAAEEDETKSKKIRSSRGKRRRGHRSRSRSRSLSDSDSPARKRSKKKIADKKSKKNKGSSHRRRHRSLSPNRSSPSSVSRSYSHRSCSTCHSSSSASERSVSPPPRSRSRDTMKGKGRGRDREKDRKRRRTRISGSYLSNAAGTGSSRSKGKSRKRRVAGTSDDASRDKIAQDYDSRCASWTEKNSIEDVDRDEEAVAVSKKGKNDIDGHEKNVDLEKMKTPPSDDANETEEIIPAGSGSPEAEDLELILRQKALENFRKFRGAAAIAGKTDNNGTDKEVVTGSPQNTVTKIAEARSAVTPFQRHGSSLGVSHSAGSPRLNDSGNGMSPLKLESSPGMSRGAGSPGILEAGDTSTPIEQQGSSLEVTLSTSEIRSQDGRNSGSVMQRLGSVPGSSATVKQRLGSSAGVSHVDGTPKVRSVVSIPSRGGLDGSTFVTPLTASENSAPVGSGSEVRHLPIENEKAEGTNGDGRKTSEASTPNGSILSTAEGNSQAGIEGKDGSQFEKKTLSRMHDGETVQVSYKVYIPKKSPALARRRLQR